MKRLPLVGLLVALPAVAALAAPHRPAEMEPADAVGPAGAPAGVSPGGTDGFAASEACPTFSWTAVAGAAGYELRVYALDERSRVAAAPALEAAIPAGASSWTPAADRCLAAGQRYGWSVRAITETAQVRGQWSEALLFAVTALPSDLAAALAVLRDHLGPDGLAAALEAAGSAGPEASSSGEDQAGLPSTQNSAVQQGAGGPIIAVRGEVPDVAGETYGVRGVSNSVTGAGVRADNNNASGADLMLGGSPVASLTELGLSRDSPSNLAFNFTNPGAGTMTVQADGSNLVTAAGGSALWVDQTGDTMTGTLSLGNNPLTSVGPVALATASEVTKGGSRFLFDDTLLFNFAAGRNALPANTTGGNSTAIGQYALLANTIGSYNTALGRSAMFSNTTGTFNVALGSLALGNNTTGGRNTAIGDYALRSNTTGGYNVAVGQYAMQVTGTAFANVAVGNNSLRNNTAGVGNVALGPGALYYSTGNTNVAVGYGAGNTVTTGSNNILIGHNGTSGDSGIIRIGGGAQTAAFIDGIHGATAAGGLGVFVNADGQLGTATSSRRFKEDIAELGGASEALFDLRPVSFHYTEEAVGPGERPLEYGLIAEEVAEVFPELVVYGEDGAPYTVRYHLLVPLLLNEVQRERVRSEALLARIEALEGRRAGDGT